MSCGEVRDISVHRIVPLKRMCDDQDYGRFAGIAVFIYINATL
jgi:hypothetical protein